MRTMAGALVKGSAMVSGATLAKSWSSGGRVVTEAIGLSKTPENLKIDRTVIIVCEKEDRTERPTLATNCNE